MNEHGGVSKWKECKNLLCVRTDNMGDIIMSGPAFQLLKQHLQCRITLLASHQGAPIAQFLPDIDEVIEGHYPFVKDNADDPEEMLQLIAQLQKKNFDAAIIFTVYSQAALPAALILYLARIPLRLAYARENPYHLLTDWAVDNEPYSLIRHQVERDVHLLTSIGINGAAANLSLRLPAEPVTLNQRLNDWQILPGDPFFILHPGVSEEKRQYPAAYWTEILRQLSGRYGYPVIITGTTAERDLAASIIGDAPGAFNAAGLFSMAEWLTLVSRCFLMVSVNTASIHLAAAFQVPVAVLYAMTNPQHTPWKSPHTVMPFSVAEKNKSCNAVVCYVDEHHYGGVLVPPPCPESVAEAVHGLLQEVSQHPAGR